MEELKVFYDEINDILYLAREGREEEFIEVFPGINIEMEEGGNFLGIEILNASRILRDVVEPLRKKVVTR